MLKQVLDQADLMDRMMEAVGVAAARAARLDRGMAWYEARCRCITCQMAGNAGHGSPALSSARRRARRPSAATPSFSGSPKVQMANPIRQQTFHLKV